MGSSYFVSYYWRNNFFSKGFGWSEIICDQINSGNDILTLQELIKKDRKLKKVIILKIELLKFFVDETDKKPFWPVNDWA